MQNNTEEFRSSLGQSRSMQINIGDWEKDQAENEDRFGGEDFLNDLVEQLKEVDGVYKISQMTIVKLNNELRMSKLFLNMVIHDCRNPTASIKIGLTLVLDQMKDITQITIDQAEFG